MEKQENALFKLFKQLGEKTEKGHTPDLRLKDAVFSTVDATRLVADILELFTVQFAQTQAEVVDSLPIAGDYGDDKTALMRILEKKFSERNNFFDNTTEEDLDF